MLATQEVQQEDASIEDGKSSKNKNVSLVRVAELADILAEKMEGAISEVDKINRETHMLSINARIEASRADEAGKAFTVVAEEMNNLSQKTSTVTNKMREVTHQSISEIGQIIREQAVHLHGVRLSDLALVNIDLIDRNLYERTCDVRWWATDGDMVNALDKKDIEIYRHASSRLGIILNAYTVYYDLILADLEGNIVANGNSEYKSQGMNVSEQEWFKDALETNSGEEYGFKSVSKCPLVNEKLSLIYSCSVREGGNQNGKILGVLGAVFNWENLAQTIMKLTPLPEEEKELSRICIVDDEGLVLADSDEKMLNDVIRFDKRNQLFAKNEGYIIASYNDKKSTIAHAKSLGYEGYKTGWHSLIVQQIKTE